MSKQRPWQNWVTFYFDGDSWSGVVDSLVKFKELLNAYKGIYDLGGFLNRVECCPHVEDRVIPRFDFCTSGLPTLGEWFREKGIDIHALLATTAK